MARKKSEYVSSFGKAFEIWKALTDDVLARGGDDGDIGRILTSKTLREKLVDVILEAKKFSATLFPLILNYADSLATMIARGHYDWVNIDVTERHFPSEKSCGKVELSLELIHFNRFIESDEAVKELDRMGLRPATLRELLAFGEKYPEKQREFPIIALGSVWRDLYGFGYVPYLCRFGAVRGLYLFGWSDGWFEPFRFLAVRKSV